MCSNFTSTLFRVITNRTCWSYPGLLPSSGSGQKLGISAGQYGCLDSKRLVMKTLFHVLGKRSEHNRPDRDDYLDMHLDNLDPGQFGNEQSLFLCSTQSTTANRGITCFVLCYFLWQCLHPSIPIKSTWTARSTTRDFRTITTA